MSILYRPPKHKGPHVRLELPPTVFELDEILEALKAFDPIKVGVVRRDIKWVQKASSKFLGIDFETPYWPRQ